MLRAEGPVQPYLQKTNPPALGVQVLHHLLETAGNTAHGDGHLFGPGISVIAEGPVIPPCQRAHAGHIVLHNPRNGVVVGVHRLPELEGRIRVDDGGAHQGMFAVQSVGPETVQSLPVHHLGQVAVIQQVDFLDLVAGSKTVEKVHKGHPGADGGEMGHRRQIHALLHTGGGQLGKTRLTAGHNVGVIAKDGKRAGSHRPGRHVDHPRQQLSCDAVQRRDHQHQPLAGGIACGQRPGLQRAVHGAAGTRLALHLHQPHRLAEEIAHSIGRPRIHMLRHGAGGRDGVDRRNFCKRIAGIGGGLVAVHSLPLHDISPLRFCSTSLTA